MAGKHKTFSLRLDDHLIALTDELKEKNQLSVLLRLFFTALHEDKLSTVSFLMGQSDNGVSTRESLLRGSLYSEYISRGFKNKGISFKEFIDDMDSVQLNSLGVSFGTGLTGEEVQSLVSVMGAEFKNIPAKVQTPDFSAESDFENSVVKVLEKNRGLLLEILGISKNLESYGVGTLSTRQGSKGAITSPVSDNFDEEENTLDAVYVPSDTVSMVSKVDLGKDAPKEPKISKIVVNDEDTSTSGFIEIKNTGIETEGESDLDDDIIVTDSEDDEIYVTDIEPEEDGYTSGFDILDGLGL